MDNYDHAQTVDIRPLFLSAYQEPGLVSFPIDFQIFILRVPQGESVRTYDSETNQCSELEFFSVELLWVSVSFTKGSTEVDAL